MLSQSIKDSIDSFYQDIKSSNLIYLNAKEGKLGPQNIQRYLASVRYLIQHTPIHLRLALQESQRRNQTELAAYFETKLIEEVGHDKWAEEDLVRMGQTPQDTLVAPAIRKLVDNNEQLILQNPELYLIYIFFAEYFTVLGGPEWLAMLQNNCGIPTSQMSVVDNHVELDKSHVMDGIAEINKLITNSQDSETYLAALRGSMQVMNEFYNDVGTCSN